MAALSRKNYKTIEWHFYHYQEVKAAAEKEREDILNAANYAAEASGIHSTATSDQTGKAVIRLEAVRDNAAWCEVVEATVEKYKKGPIGLLINMLYVEKMSIYRICDSIGIDRSTFYNWRTEIVTYAAMKACEKKLIKV